MADAEAICEAVAIARSVASLGTGAWAHSGAIPPLPAAQRRGQTRWLTKCIDVRPLVSIKPVKQRFCLANVGNLKALRECPVHRCKDLPCVGLPVLPDPETRKA